MNELKFPFKFRAFGLDPIYTARSSGEDSVEISWYNDECKFRTRMYTSADVAENVARNIWRIEKPDQTDPEVVIKQSDYDSLVDEINMLHELVAEITAETDYTALGQQASTYRALNEKMTKHTSYKQGGGGSTRESELLEQLDVLFEAYDNVVYVEKEEEQTFKPISEMTLGDWQQAMEEGWEFQTEQRGEVEIVDVDFDDETIKLKTCFRTWWVDSQGHDFDSQGYTIVKRIK